MKRCFVTAAALLIVCAAGASMLNWDGSQWPHGFLTETYFIDGVMVDMAFTGAVGSLISSHSAAYNQALPTDDWDRNAWSPTAPDALWWGVKELVSEGAPLEFTISFDTPVTDVAFCLYDLDGVELIYLSGELAGNNVYPSMVSPGSIDYTPATGRLYGNGISGNPGAANNTACIDFSGPIDKIVLSYSGPKDTGVMLGDLEFVPEPASLTLLAMGAGALLRTRKKS